MCLSTSCLQFSPKWVSIYKSLTFGALVYFQGNIQNTYLGGILIGVAFLNGFIEFYQLQKSEAILASFLAMIPPSCRVVRNGVIETIAAAELVKGDVVLLVSLFLSTSNSDNGPSSVLEIKRPRI